MLTLFLICLNIIHDNDNDKEMCCFINFVFKKIYRYFFILCAIKQIEFAFMLRNDGDDFLRYKLLVVVLIPKWC